MVGEPRSRHRSVRACSATGRNRPPVPLTTVEMIEADAGELGERDGENGEIDPGDAEAEGEIADHRAAGGRDRDRGEHAEPRARRRNGRTKSPRRRRRARHRGVAERELPGKAHHDVPGLPGIGEIQNDDEDGEEIIVDEPRRRHERGEQERRATARRAARRRRRTGPIMPPSGRAAPAGGTAAPAPECRTRTCSWPTA